MSFLLRNASILAIGSMLIGVTSTAMAATTATSTFQVTANVQAVCQISSSNLNFGNYSGVQLTANSTISVTCTQNQGYDVGLDGGSGAQSVSARKMTGPGGTVLGYGLYRDANYTSNWGNTIGSDVVHGNGSGATQSLTVYGKLPANQLVTPGAYADTITATITY